MDIKAIKLVRLGDYACVEVHTDAGWTEVVREYIDAPFSHTVHEAGIKARIEDKVGVPYTLPIPNGVYYNVEADNFYHMSWGGMGSEFYMVWRERREEFPRTIRRT